MSVITVSAGTLTTYAGDETTLKLRIYCRKTFAPSTGGSIVRGRVGTTQFYKEVNCTASLGVVSHAGFTIDSTEDGTPATSYYAFALYTDAGLPVSRIYRRILVPASPTSTTLEALVVHSDETDAIVADTLTYSRTVIDAMFAALVNMATKMTEVIYGAGKLSVPAIDASIPIVVGDNDRRIGARISSYVSLSAAITAMAAVGGTIDLSADETISSAITVPSNVRFRPTFGAKFVKSGSGTITFQGVGIVGDPQHQIFSGFAAGNITWTGDQVPVMRPEWFGADPTGVADSLLAFQTANAAYTDTQSGTYTGGCKGVTLLLAAGASYSFTNTLELQRATYLIGGGWSAYTVPRMLFPANKIGIIVHGGDTRTGTATAPINAIGSQIKGVIVEATTGAQVNNCIITNSGDLAFDLQGGGSITSVSLYGSNDGTVTSLAPGFTITLNNFPYVVASTIDTSPTVTIPIEKPRFSCSANGSTTITKASSARLPNANDWVGSTIRLFASDGTYVDRTISSQTTSTIVVNSAVTSGTVIYAEVQGVASISNQNARLNIYHGIDLRTITRLDGVMVTGFNGNGVNLQSIRYPSSSLSVSPNLNASRLVQVYSNYNEGTGFLVSGGNCNQMTFDQCDAQECRGWGFYENASSGNNYIGFHTSNNTAGHFSCQSNISNSILSGCYAESSQPPGRLAASNLVVGGTYGAGWSGTTYSPHLRHSYGYLFSNMPVGFLRPAGHYIGNINTVGIRGHFGSNDVLNGIAEFGAGNESFNTGLGGTAANCDYAAYKLIYNLHATGWYGWHYGTTAADCVLAFSGSNAAASQKHLAFPLGFRTKVTDPEITRVLKGTVTINPASINATTVSSQTFTLTGAVVGDSLTLNPPAAGLTAGLLVMQCFVSAADTITVVFYNTTGAPIDEGSASWNYLIHR